MSSIDIENFYCKLVTEKLGVTEQFSLVNEDSISYLEDMERVPKLVEYQPESRNDFELLYDEFCDVDIPEMKIECMKRYIKEYIKFEKINKKEVYAEKKNKGVIPAYIYKF